MSDWHISGEHMAAMHEAAERSIEEAMPDHRTPEVRITAGFIAEVPWPFPYAHGFGETEEEARVDLALQLHKREHGCQVITECDVAYELWRQLYEMNPGRHTPMA